MKLVYSPRDTTFVLCDAEEDYFLPPNSDTPVPDALAEQVANPLSIFAKVGIMVLTGDEEKDRGLRAIGDARWRSRRRTASATMSPDEIRNLERDTTGG